MQVTHHQENREILQQLIDNATSDVRKVLKCYNYDHTEYTIRRKMKKMSNQDLTATAEYLKNVQPKSEPGVLRNAIINRIDCLLLEDCRICKTYFAVTREESPTVTCSSCGQGAHESCYRDVAAVISDYPGIQYRCSRCADVNLPTVVTNPVTAADEEDAATLDNSNNNPHSSQHVETDAIQFGESDELRVRSEEEVDGDDVIFNNQMQQRLHDRVRDRSNRSNDDAYSHYSHHFDDEDDEGDWREQSRPTCEKFRRGVCPHGISGLTPVNGQRCFFRHPKRCMPYCRYGTDSRQGCSRGRDCELMHPILCKYSLNYRCCTNLKCRYTHLKMTRRYRTREQRNQINQQTSFREDR